jgi:hypothetical protein
MTKTPCCTSRRAPSGAAQGRAGWCGLISKRCAAGRARKTITWKSPRSFHTVLLPSDVPYMPVRMASRGAALYLAGGCAVRPARQAGHVGRRAAAGAVHRGPDGPRVSAHGVASQEMQSQEYLELERRTVDTGLDMTQAADPMDDASVDAARARIQIDRANAKCPV